jgi:hypothetical protein
MPRHASSSYASSEALNDHVSVADHHPRRAISKATMSHLARPLSQPLDHLLTNRSAVDENKLVRPALNSDLFDEEDRQRQEDEQEDEDYDNDNEDRRQPQQEVKEYVVAALMTRKIAVTSKRDRQLLDKHYASHSSR